jgi:hypothetical protein
MELREEVADGSGRCNADVGFSIRFTPLRRMEEVGGGAIDTMFDGGSLMKAEVTGGSFALVYRT